MSTSQNRVNSLSKSNPVQNGQNKTNQKKIIIKKPRTSSSNSRENDAHLKKHKQWKQSLVLNSYMGSFIKKATSYSFHCLKCKEDIFKKTGKEDMWCENVYPHILSSVHKKNTPNGESSKYETLKALIYDKSDKKEKKDNVEESKEEIEFNTNKDAYNYLKFLAFTVAERLSYQQIHKLGNFLQALYKNNQLEFLENFSFDEESISKIVSDCFRVDILEQIHEDLKKSQFSFSIDSATFVRESICALRVKYLKEVTLENQLLEKKVTNKFIGLSSLKESSNAETMLRIVEDKILINQEIHNNLIGLTHDNLETLASNANGLVGLLKDCSSNFIYNVADPCHGISLSLKHAITNNLPDEIMDFIVNIHTFFNYSQRKAELRNIQEKENMKVLSLKKYVDTRWLSLGVSLQRLLEIWPSLQAYIHAFLPKKSKKDVKKLQEFGKLLDAKDFELKLRALSYIINQLNSLSEKLQNHTFNIAILKTEMKLCFKTLLKLFCSSDILDKSLEELINIDWEAVSKKNNHLLGKREFITKLKNYVHPSFEFLLEAGNSSQEKFTKIFQEFLGKLLNNLLYYLPFHDDIINSVDFLEMKEKTSELEEKILKLNQIFKIVEEEELRTQVFPQLLRLREINFSQVMSEENDLALDFWCKISQHGQYPSLIKFFRLAQTLPTSSSDIEQAFSILKLFKNNQRNRLSEKSLEGLMLIHQEYANKEIVISKRALQLFHEIRNSLNERKSENSLPVRRSYGNFIAQQVEEIDENIQAIANFDSEIITQDLKKCKTNELEFKNNSQPSFIVNLSDVEEIQLYKSLIEENDEEEIIEISYTK